MCRSDPHLSSRNWVSSLDECKMADLVMRTINREPPQHAPAARREVAVDREQRISQSHPLLKVSCCGKVGLLLYWIYY